jgi:hypothetical protein
MSLGHMTAEEVIAYFECPTKAALLAQSIPADEPAILLNLYQKYRSAYSAVVEQATGRKLVQFDQLGCLVPITESYCLVDSQSVTIDCKQLVSSTQTRALGAAQQIYLPCFSTLSIDRHLGAQRSFISLTPQSVTS